MTVSAATGPRRRAYNEALKAYYRSMLDGLEQLFADRAELTFTGTDLRRLGVGDARPDPSDYPEFGD